MSKSFLYLFSLLFCWGSFAMEKDPSDEKEIYRFATKEDIGKTVVGHPIDNPKKYFRVLRLVDSRTVMVESQSKLGINSSLRLFKQFVVLDESNYAKYPIFTGNLDDSQDLDAYGNEVLKLNLDKEVGEAFGYEERS